MALGAKIDEQYISRREVRRGIAVDIFNLLARVPGGLGRGGYSHDQQGYPDQ